MTGKTSLFLPFMPIFRPLVSNRNDRIAVKYDGLEIVSSGAYELCNIVNPRYKEVVIQGTTLYKEPNPVYRCW